MPGYQSLPPTRFLLTHRTRLWPAIVAAAATSLAAAPADGERTLAELADPAAKVRKVAADCRFTDGPAWSPDGRLLFSDIPNNRIVELLAEGALRDFLAPSGRANGLVVDRAGRTA